MASSNDEPDLREIKRLLERLQQSPLSRRLEAPKNRAGKDSYPGFTWRPPQQRGRPTTAMLLFIASIILVTATAASIGWYRLQPAAIEQGTKAIDKPEHERADGGSQPPLANALLEARPAGVAPGKPATKPQAVTISLPSFADAADLRMAGPPPEATAEKPRTEITTLPSDADSADVRPAGAPPEATAEKPRTEITTLLSDAGAADVRPAGPPREVTAEKPRTDITSLPSDANATDVRTPAAPPEVTDEKPQTEIVSLPAEAADVRTPRAPPKTTAKKPLATSPPRSPNRDERRDSDKESKAREVAEFCYEQRSICRKICDLRSNFDDRFDGCSHSCDSRESRCSRTGCYRWAEPEYVVAQKFGGEKCPL